MEFYIPAGSILTGTIITGAVYPTGKGSFESPMPALIRLSKSAILPNRYMSDIRECFLSFLQKTVAVTSDQANFTVMQQSVQHGCCENRFTQHASSRGSCGFFFLNLQDQISLGNVLVSIACILSLQRSSLLIESARHRLLGK